MLASAGVADSLALGLVSFGLGLVAYCLGLDPKPVWGGEERRLAGDGLFFVPFFSLLAAAFGLGVRLGLAAVVPMIGAFPVLAGGLGYALRYLYASHRTGLEKAACVLGVAAVLAYLPWIGEGASATGVVGWLG